MKKQNVRTLSLIVCTFTYLLVGAAVFDALESETEMKRWEVLQAVESMVIRKYKITPEDFRVMETVVLKSEPHKAGQQWKFTGAFYYATTVLTTIGYGHSTPTTIGGKLFTMFYAIVGIPLGLIMFQSIGERVNKASSVIIRHAKTAFKCAHTAASELDLICVVTTLSSLTIAGGAAAFSKFEGWTYFDSVYYCFITLTTIGFGDMVALQKDNALNRKPSYVIFSLVFILFGLAIVAACLNLLVLRFVTMNTEDERRDEQQAMQALRGAVRLEGDVITADGEILRGVSKGTRLPADPRQIAEGAAMIPPSNVDFESAPSVCSCSCGCFGQHKLPYRDPLSPIPPTDFRPGKGRGAGSNKSLPRFIERSSAKNHSQTLRLNSASGCLCMNARSTDFQLDSDDFKEIIRKRQEQLRKGMSKMEYPTKSPRVPTVESGMCETDLNQPSSIFSMDGKHSTDPLMADHGYEESSYARRKLMRNLDRNLPKKKKDKSNFYDDCKMTYDADYLYDSSMVFAKRRKVDNGENIMMQTFSMDPVTTETCPWYCQSMKKNDSFHYGPDQLSNDGSFGYYLTPEDEEEYKFVNDTLTFAQPEHRSSI